MKAIKPVKSSLIPVLRLLSVVALPLVGNSAETPPPTTRQQTVRPLALPADTRQIPPRDASLYKLYGYSAWQLGPGEDAGRRFDLMPAGYQGAANAAKLLSFFSLSDIHLTDKESPAQVPFFGWSAPFHGGGLYASAYSPIMRSTTHVLNDAVKTINGLHQQNPFDFGLVLGDVGNASQYNEIRWFIDVMDGQRITPSSGAHLGADTIDYQKPYQVAGLDRSIPWYEAIGNHDQFWMGVAYPTEKVKKALVGGEVLNMNPNVLVPNASEGSGIYMGVVDGTTRYGEVIKGGPTDLFKTPPTVVADPNRRSLTTEDTGNALACTNFMSEFFQTESLPKGHGFSRSNLENKSASYSFLPKTDLPLKVIVFDDTCKLTGPSGGPLFYGGGWVDAARYTWLTNELQQGQDAGQLMIIAAHIPIDPQLDVFDADHHQPQFYVTAENQSQFPDCKTEAQMLTTLHQYPNLLMFICGHRHLNTVTPQPSTDPAHPENGFWEVETPSLRDFPQQFRTWELRRNRDNTISIITTDVDPQVADGSPAADSRGFAIGASRAIGITAFADTTSHAYNAELVKSLTPAMQAKIAGCGTPLGQPGR
jgi:metallophosphoesterase (TIGR03768 family)